MAFVSALDILVICGLRHLLIVYSWAWDFIVLLIILFANFVFCLIIISFYLFLSLNSPVLFLVIILLELKLISKVNCILNFTVVAVLLIFEGLIVIFSLRKLDS